MTLAPPTLVDRKSRRSVEDVVGNAFIQVLAESDTKGHFMFEVSDDYQLIQAFAKDVRRRKEGPSGSYEDFIDLAASAAAHVLTCGPQAADKSEDPVPLSLYRRMVCLVKRPHEPSALGGETGRADGDHELETTKHQQLLTGAYESGFSAGLEAGARAEASKSHTSLAETEGAYAQGFAAGQRRLMNSELAFAFARGQQAAKEQVRAGLERMGEQDSRARLILEELLGETTATFGPLQHSSLESASPKDGPAQASRAHRSRGSDSSRPSARVRLPEVASAPGAVLSCPAGSQSTTSRVPAPAAAPQTDTLSSRRRGRPPLVPDRKHNYSPPGDSNAFTENIKFLKRMPINLQLSIIDEAAQQLNTVKLRIQDLEAQLRRIKPTYISRHGLPDVYCLHESRPQVLSAIIQARGRLPYIIQELRQLTRARGMRSQIRNDEGTWWEVADDLEAGLDPSSKLAQAVAALPPPDRGPTIHLNANTISEAPNMKDPSWRPQYALPLQIDWKVSGPDDNPVLTRAGPGPRGGPSAVAEPAIKKEPEDDEEDGGYGDLMANISRRVLVDSPQSDWTESRSDEGGEEPAGAEDDATRDGLGRSNGRIGTPTKRNMSAAISSTPRMIKHHRIV
ncbi:hypothetical protein DHEL01_v206425 [Diaporthe helianthi]|uniref:Uncharacterized protein n=1 Tax=Diaporthe helianthi TaxID=158607 RepID=A0A2P5HY54_DIAHE|nr:hypothetical protein DHEL01_v206425 [Diaporthe helianthi]